MFQLDRDDTNVFVTTRPGVSRNSTNRLCFLWDKCSPDSSVCTKTGSYALSVQVRKPKREQLCCLQRDSDESTASFVKTPLGFAAFDQRPCFLPDTRSWRFMPAPKVRKNQFWCLGRRRMFQHFFRMSQATTRSIQHSS